MLYGCYLLCPHRWVSEQKEWLILITRAAVTGGDPAIDSVYCLLSDGSRSAHLTAKQEVKDASEFEQAKWPQ